MNINWDKNNNNNNNTLVVVQANKKIQRQKQNLLEKRQKGKIKKINW